MNIDTDVMLLIGEKIDCEEQLVKYLEYLRREGSYTHLINYFAKKNPDIIHWVICNNYLELFKIFPYNYETMMLLVALLSVKMECGIKYLQVLKDDSRYKKHFDDIIRRGGFYFQDIIEQNDVELFDRIFTQHDISKIIERYCTSNSLNVITYLKFLHPLKKYHSVFLTIAKSYPLWMDTILQDQYSDFFDLLCKDDIIVNYFKEYHTTSPRKATIYLEFLRGKNEYQEMFDAIIQKKMFCFDTIFESGYRELYDIICDRYDIGDVPMRYYRGSPSKTSIYIEFLRPINKYQHIFQSLIESRRFCIHTIIDKKYRELFDILHINCNVTDTIEKHCSMTLSDYTEYLELLRPNEQYQKLFDSIIEKHSFCLDTVIRKKYTKLFDILHMKCDIDDKVTKYYNASDGNMTRYLDFLRSGNIHDEIFDSLIKTRGFCMKTIMEEKYVDLFDILIKDYNRRDIQRICNSSKEMVTEFLEFLRPLPKYYHMFINILEKNIFCAYTIAENDYIHLLKLVYNHLNYDQYKGLVNYSIAIPDKEISKYIMHCIRSRNYPESQERDMSEIQEIVERFSNVNSAKMRFLVNNIGILNNIFR